MHRSFLESAFHARHTFKFGQGDNEANKLFAIVPEPTPGDPSPTGIRVVLASVAILAQDYSEARVCDTL